MTDLRSWLKRSPRPAKVRCDEKIVSVGPGRWKWAECERAIQALAPSRVEALDAAGDVLRAVDLEQADPDAAAPAKADKSSELAQLATIIADAADRAALRHGQAYETAYKHQTALVELLAKRLSGLEQAWTQTLRQNALSATNGDGEHDQAGALLAQLISSQLAPSAPGKPKAAG